METNIAERLQNLESELHSLRSLIITLSHSHEPRKIVKLKGFLAGIEVSEEDINSSKESLFTEN